MTYGIKQHKTSLVKIRKSYFLNASMHPALLTLITSKFKVLYFRFLDRAKDNRVADRSWSGVLPLLLELIMTVRASDTMKPPRVAAIGRKLSERGHLGCARSIALEVLRRTFVIASLTALAAGCATDKRPEKKTAAGTPAVALTGANGNMSKYLGTWTSNCGREYQVTPTGSAALTSGTNSFSFTSVSGNTVEGTLAIDTHESRDCSGPPKRTSAKITMSYVGNIAVRSSFGEGTLFTGSADKVTATLAGSGGANGGNTFNIGFLEGFNGFQLAPLDYFSSTNLVYTKKP